jgi:hypothetical protein
VVISTSNRIQCAATKRNGQPCAAYAVAGGDFCFWHDPDRQADRDAACSRGGKARHGRAIGTTGAGDSVALSTVADVVCILRDTIRDCLALENSIARARTMGYLAGMAVRALEVSELEARVEALERTLKVRGEG